MTNNYGNGVAAAAEAASEGHVSDTTDTTGTTLSGGRSQMEPAIKDAAVAVGDPQDGPRDDPRDDPGQRPRKAIDKTAASPRSRFSLRMSAGLWRSLQYVAMSLHFMASPRPPAPDFTKTIPSTLMKTKQRRGGDDAIGLHFYTPTGYGDPESKKRGTTYPVVVNFHGGGFVLGAASDDARFGRHVTETAGAIFVSVDYRLAPESPFPTAVEDSADALLYLIRNAAELRIDPMRMATSGFSAGGNLCLTSLLRLGDYKRDTGAPLPEHRILATAAWYPTVDLNRTRAERRASCTRPDQTLPETFTSLFDASYLFPADLDLLHPYISPYQASDEQIVRDLPHHVLIYTCEWDMLQKEGEEFAHRLQKAPISKEVYHKMVMGVVHGWDKSPSPRKLAEQSEELYNECCQKLKVVFNQ